MDKETIKKYIVKFKTWANNKRLKKAKLGVTYSVFNGEEILRFSLLSIRQHVDYINVVYQQISWTGTECDKSLITTLESLKSEGLIDNIIEYNFSRLEDHRKMGHLVIEKKMRGVQDLKKRGCTHCLIMDVDELYDPLKFKEAKEFIIENNISHSACPIYDYRYYPEVRCRDVAIYSVPFIFKLKGTSHLSARHHMPCRVDDLRTFKYNKYFDKFYYMNTISMNHMTGLRKNFNSKLDATITNFDVEGKNHIDKVRLKDQYERNLSIDELINLADEENGGYIKVANYFNISI